MPPDEAEFVRRAVARDADAARTTLATEARALATRIVQRITGRAVA